MNQLILKPIGGVFCLALILSSAFAQTSVPVPQSGTQPTGLLGKTYGFLDADVRDSTNSNRPTNWGPTVGMNQALAPQMDFGANYSYSRGTNTAFKIRNDSVGANVTGYYPFGKTDQLFALTPFIRGGLGYAWNRTERFGVSNNRNVASYNGAAGVEFPVANGLSLRATGTYHEDFDSPHDHGWNYAGSANYWVSNTWSLNVAVTLDEGRNGHTHNATNYSTGVRIAY